MKRRLIIKAITEIGYEFSRGDGNHDIFERDGMPPLQIPKHTEINNNTARKILTFAGIPQRLKK